MVFTSSYGYYSRIDAEHWRAEAERLAAENIALRTRIGELEARTAVLSEKVTTLAKLVFGTSSEKKNAG